MFLFEMLFSYPTLRAVQSIWKRNKLWNKYQDISALICWSWCSSSFWIYVREAGSATVIIKKCFSSKGLNSHFKCQERKNVGLNVKCSLQSSLCHLLAPCHPQSNCDFSLCLFYPSWYCIRRFPQLHIRVCLQMQNSMNIFAELNSHNALQKINLNIKF